MPVPLIPCQHDVTGAFADLPETGIQHFPGWSPVGQPEEPTVSELPEQPTAADDAPKPADDGQATTEDAAQLARPAKRKAATASATTPEEG